ncbi:MAG: hypothetical protein CL878_12520 [Dehalococcoidia bacterium]|nr:hypothetical protein [Dehalococcoidia bacterium]
MDVSLVRSVASRAADAAPSASQSGARRIARNAAAVFGADSWTRLVSLVLVIAIARALGEAALGSYVLALAAIFIGSATTSLGLNPYLTRELAKSADRREHQRLVGAALGARIMVGAPIALVLATGTALLPIGIPSAPLVALVALAIVTASIGELFAAALRGVEAFGAVAGISVAARLLLVAAVALSLLLGQGVQAALTVHVLTNAILAWFFYHALRGRIGALGIVWAPSDWRQLLPEALPFAGIGIGAIVFLRSDVLLLGAIRGPAEVSWYASAARLLETLELLPAAIVAASFPAMARLQTTAAGYAILRQGVVRGALWLGVLSLLAVGALALLRQPLTALLFGDLGARAASTLVILVWAVPPLFLRSLAGHVLYAVGRQRDVLVVLLLATLASTVMNLLFMPVWGYQAAAVSRVVAEVFLTGWLGYLALGQLAPRRWQRGAGFGKSGRVLLGLGIGTLWSTVLTFVVIPTLSDLAHQDRLFPETPASVYIALASVVMTVAATAALVRRCAHEAVRGLAVPAAGPGRRPLRSPPC